MNINAESKNRVEYILIYLINMNEVEIEVKFVKIILTWKYQYLLILYFVQACIPNLIENL